ncbi:MAG: PASTA domain-containing protein, partial [Candidatus Kapabacteria bacterium]|nr:PASTA domain-containing protein [Candidatus Kapabacteria bacterium]
MATTPSGITKSTILKYALIAVASLLVVVVGCDKILMPFIVSTSKTIKVPSVVGKQRQQAMDLLESQGLTVSQDQIIEVYNEKVPKDQIIMQMPFAGSDVKEG